MKFQIYNVKKISMFLSFTKSWEPKLDPIKSGHDLPTSTIDIDHIHKNIKWTSYICIKKIHTSNFFHVWPKKKTFLSGWDETTSKWNLTCEISFSATWLRSYKNAKLWGSFNLETAILCSKDPRSTKLEYITI